MNPNNILFFDIETTAHPQAQDFIQVKPPANYKDPEKIAAYVAEKAAEQLAMAALDPDLGAVRAIAWRIGLDGETVVRSTAPDYSETDLLDDFWSVLSGYKVMGRCCGYNILAFDLPFLLHRSMDLGVRVAAIPNLARYRTDPIVDLYAVLYNWGPGKGLKWVAKRFGLHNPLPELEGSQVAGMDEATLRAYVANDICLTVQLYRRMCGVYFPALQQEEPF